MAPMDPNHFELHEQFTLDHPPLTYETQPQQDSHPLLHDTPDDSGVKPEHELTTEEKLQNLLEADSVPADSNVSVAAAATARINPSFLDPQLHVFAEEATSESIDNTDCCVVSAAPDASEPLAPHSLVALPEQPDNTETPATTADFPVSPMPTTHGGEAAMVLDYVNPPSEPERPVTPMTSQTNDPSTPWTELTYIPHGIVQAPATVSSQSQQLALTLTKGGMRMETTSPNGTRQKNARARFGSERRKEVQEVRRIGACIRCRILRKVCSKGTPCDTCRKVLSPRVWRTGCVRTKLAEQLELYSAGVQIVVAQKRVNKLRADYQLSNRGVVIEASHFEDTDNKLVLQMLEGHLVADIHDSKADPESRGQDIMIDYDKEDIPAKVETYMRQVLPELIRREQSSHVRVTLECAAEVAEETSDELLRRALDLWGLVELMDRERQWSFLRKTSDGSDDSLWINEDSHSELFTNICMQLTAAAERRAAATSKSLLNGIQRNLQDGKTKLGFPMFLTAMVFLNCVEKTTWAFKAWEGESIRSLWPLEKQPDKYYNQGYDLCDLLKMLLVIRHTLPRAVAHGPDIPLVAREHESEKIKKFYRDLNVTRTYSTANNLSSANPCLASFLENRRQNFSFDQSDSRSLEFLFCSSLLSV